jgi:hypothetical protein
LNFNGVDDYVNVGNGTSLNGPSTSNQVTLSAWIYPNQVAWQEIIDKNTGAGAVGAGAVYMLELEASGQIRCHIHNTTDNDAINLYTGSYSLNTWQLVSCSYDGSVASLYVNGTLIGSQNSLGGTIYSGSTQNLTIGYLEPGIRYFNGTIDDVAIWNRSLSATEISTLYNMSSGFPKSAWSNVTKVVNSTVGSTIRWQVYANDTSNNWNKTDIYFYGDATPPTFSNYNANTTGAGKPVNFSVVISDNYALSGYIFSTNNTGVWVNYT